MIMKEHKDPTFLEFDETEDVVDVFVRKDPECPYPFHQDDWYHQGFYLYSFIMILNTFFRKNKLPYKVTFMHQR